MDIQQEKYQVNSNYYSDQVKAILGVDLFERLRKQMKLDSNIGLDYTWQEAAHVYKNCRYLLDEMSLYEAIESARGGERSPRGFEGLHASLGYEILRSENEINRVLEGYFLQDEITQVVTYCGGYPNLKSLDERSFTNLINTIASLIEKFSVQAICDYLWSTRKVLFNQGSLEQ